MAAKPRVATPDRGGERFRQLPRTVSPPSQISLLAVLERHRGDAARAAATAREANQRHRRAAALKLLPHILVSEELPAPVAQARRVRSAGLPTGRRPAQRTVCAFQDGHERWRHPRAPCNTREGLPR